MLSKTFLLVSALLLAAGPQQPASRSPKRAPPARRVEPPAHRLLVTGKVGHDSAAQLEQLFKQHLLPVLGGDRRVAALDCYADVEAGTYAMALEVRMYGNPSANDLANLFSKGPHEEVEKFRQLARLDQATVLHFRPDLSIVRGAAQLGRVRP
jgi:hypothetical protein